MEKNNSFSATQSSEINQVSNIVTDAKLLEILHSFDHIKGGTFGVQLLTLTQMTMRKSENPYYGRVQKLTRYTHIGFGIMYANVVKRILKRNGKNDVEYTPSTPKGMQHILKQNLDGSLVLNKKGKPTINKRFYQSVKDHDKLYLKLGIRPSTRIKVEYFIDGVKATDAERAEIEYISTHKLDGSLYANVTKENDILTANGCSEKYDPLQYTLTNIVACWQGGYVAYQNLSAMMSLVKSDIKNQVMKYFK